MHRSVATDPEDPTVSYSRIFSPASEDWDLGALEALATAMLSTDNELWPDRMDGPIPAGYTYFGQLLAHDLTYDSSEGLARYKGSKREVLNRRAPGLNLRSIYGSGPDGTDSSLYCPDGIRIRESIIGQIGHTGPVLSRDSAGQCSMLIDIQYHDPRPIQARHRHFEQQPLHGPAGMEQVFLCEGSGHGQKGRPAQPTRKVGDLRGAGTEDR